MFGSVEFAGNLKQKNLNAKAQSSQRSEQKEREITYRGVAPNCTDTLISGSFALFALFASLR
jgi:hypothetical protein